MPMYRMVIAAFLLGHGLLMAADLADAQSLIATETARFLASRDALMAAHPGAQDVTVDGSPGVRIALSDGTTVVVRYAAGGSGQPPILNIARKDADGNGYDMYLAEGREVRAVTFTTGPDLTGWWYQAYPGGRPELLYNIVEGKASGICKEWREDGRLALDRVVDPPEPLDLHLHDR